MIALNLILLSLILSLGLGSVQLNGNTYSTLQDALIPENYQSENTLVLLSDHSEDMQHSLEDRCDPSSCTLSIRYN